MKKDLKTKSIAANVDYRAACSNVRRQVESSTKLVLKKRKDKAATQIQRQVRSGKKRENAAIKIQSQVRGKRAREGKKSSPGKKRGHAKSCVKDQARSLDNIIRALKLKLETSQRSRILKSMMNVPAKTGNCNTVAIRKLFSDPEIKSKAIPAYNKLPDGKEIKQFRIL